MGRRIINTGNGQSFERNDNDKGDRIINLGGGSYNEAIYGTYIENKQVTNNFTTDFTSAGFDDSFDSSFDDSFDTGGSNYYENVGGKTVDGTDPFAGFTDLSDDDIFTIDV